MKRFQIAAALLLSIPAWAQAPDAGSAPTAGAAEKAPLNLELMPFSSDTVKRVVAHNREKIQTCYEETLASKDKPVEGRVMTSFVVTPGGLVKDPRVLKKGTTLKDPKLHACLIDALSTFTFPKPSDRREHPIEYPFNLKAVR
jgi:hypothetical protein